MIHKMIDSFIYRIIQINVIHLALRCAMCDVPSHIPLHFAFSLHFCTAARTYEEEDIIGRCGVIVSIRNRKIDEKKNYFSVCKIDWEIAKYFKANRIACKRKNESAQRCTTRHVQSECVSIVETIQHHLRRHANRQRWHVMLSFMFVCCGEW